MSMLPPEDTDEADLRPGVDRLLTDLGADPAGATRYPAGSLPVYAAGDVVLKLFPPDDAEGMPVEAGVLAAVHGRLPIPTPRPLASGERDDWAYVLMSRLDGVPLRDAWDGIEPVQRERLAAELGEAVAVLHAVPPPAIDDWEPGDWPSFVAQQRAGWVSRQRGLGLPAAWMEALAPVLETDLTGDPPVLLHTEVMREHLLVAPDAGGQWRFRGLIDFEPAMRGAREYEFVGVGTFVAEGDARFLGTFLRAYGCDPADLDGDFRRRMVAWSLLHRYSNLPAWMRRLPVPATPDPDELGRLWFGT